METFLAWVAHWLPLVQGFAALASIGGATLSWRFAIKAQRARDEMTQNMVASQALTTLEETLQFLNSARMRIIRDSQTDETLQFQYGEVKHRLEHATAASAAYAPYLSEVIPVLKEMTSALADASIEPKLGNIEFATKFLTIAIEQLKLAAITRQIRPT